MAYVRPSVIEAADAAAGTATAYAITVGQTAQGTISAGGDHDWFRVDLTAGQTYAFAEIGTGAADLQDTYLRLYDGSGTTLLREDDDSGPAYSSSFTYTPTVSGAYYLDAAAYAGTGQYGISASLGTRPNFDLPMGAGAIDADASWSAATGSPVTITYGFRQTAATTPSAAMTSRRSRSSARRRWRQCARFWGCGPRSPGSRSRR